MFTLFTVTVSENTDTPPSNGSGLEYGVTVDKVFDLDRGTLQPNQLYRLPEAGWFSFAAGSNTSELVLYFKGDDTPALCLAVTGPGEYRFGRTVRSFRAAGAGFHDGQWQESEASWGWLKSDDDELTFEIPEFVSDKLAAA